MTRVCRVCRATVTGGLDPLAASDACPFCLSRWDGRIVRREVSRPPCTSARLIEVGVRDEWVCHLCGGRTVAPGEPGYHPHDPEAATCDHLLPRSRGGLRTMANLMIAHRDCNIRRGVTPVEEARRALAAS